MLQGLTGVSSLIKYYTGALYTEDDMKLGELRKLFASFDDEQGSCFQTTNVV